MRESTLTAPEALTDTLFVACVGKTIAALAVEDSEVRLLFEDGTGVAVGDVG